MQYIPLSLNIFGPLFHYSYFGIDSANAGDLVIRDMQIASAMYLKESTVLNCGMALRFCK